MHLAGGYMKVKMFGAALLALGAVFLLYWVVVSPVSANPGYNFTPPTAISLGDMEPGSANFDNSEGSLDGDNELGYTVKGIDLKGTNTGKMVSGGNVLAAKLKIGPSASPTNDADVLTTFLTTSAPGVNSVPFYVSQVVGYGDTVADGYTITINFTVTPK